MGAARATLTCEDSEWSRKFEEPWQSRPWDWRGVGQVFLQGHIKGLAKSLQRSRVEMLLHRYIGKCIVSNKNNNIKVPICGYQNCNRVGPIRTLIVGWYLKATSRGVHLVYFGIGT